MDAVLCDMVVVPLESVVFGLVDPKFSGSGFGEANSAILELGEDTLAGSIQHGIFGKIFL